MYPQENQYYRPFDPEVQDQLSFKKGDYMAATCEFNSAKRDHVTVFGGSYTEDEMCDVYSFAAGLNKPRFCTGVENTTLAETIAQKMEQGLLI